MHVQIAADMRFLAALLILQCIHSSGATSVSGAKGCSGFRHLENGQTFFRSGGLLVVFHCHPGYKLHGYKTNSCVSGHWSRDPPVCVGSSCPDPGSLTHGTTSVNEDGSWAAFSCNRGFWLDGPSKLFCKGHSWNSTKPVCKEYDMMSSISGSSVHKPNTHQNLQAAKVLNTQQQPNRDILSASAPEEATFKPGTQSHTPFQMSNGQRITVTNPAVCMQQHIHFPNVQIRETVQTTPTTHHEENVENEAGGSETASGNGGSEVKEAGNVSPVTVIFASKLHLYNTVSPTSSTLVSTTHTQTIIAVRNALRTEVFSPTYPLSSTPQPSALPELSSEKELQSGASSTSRYDRTLSGVETGIQFHPASSGEKDESTESSTHQSTTTSSMSSTPLPTFSASLSPSPSFSLSSVTTDPRFYGTEHKLDLWMKVTPEIPPLALSLNKLPCPYPPSPRHGTFYFQNVENPGPGEYKHYIRYTCYPGYTLAHGDTHSYCQQGGTWNGTTPICLDINECRQRNGGCSHLCINQRGGHKCACPASHRLSSSSWRKCLPRTTANTAG